MGIPSSVWFVIAGVALVLGAALLLASRSADGRSRDRKRWAALSEWDYVDSDPILPSRWRYGTIHQGGPGTARHLASGSVSTADGLRQAYVFDHEQAGRISSVLAVVQLRTQLPAVELRLPSATLPEDAGLELLESVGERYAFVSDPDAVRPLLTERLAAVSDAIGDDIELLWAEDSWVLAAAPVDATQERVQDLLADLVEVATVLERSEAERQRSDR